METKNNARKNKLIYWTLNILFSLFMLLSAIPDLLSIELAQTGFKEIQLPVYLLPFLGLAKIIGVIVILIPIVSTIKEWAYAGLFYDLLGAIYCVAAGGKQAQDRAPIFIPLLIGIISYIYYRKNLSTN